ncbi:MAG: hypothetical protein DWQ56_05980 [Microcystis aeruginosa DA14]|uniref:Uncharacterized protein n=1 Tax=Microcystis aeruginosa DA14 TaxID=1987506 RepID=A0A3E0MFX7_MICAE|nr:MAG: hypothetical protein DWQ56_05980 [Microcystis aeruginosa DA14]
MIDRSLCPLCLCGSFHPLALEKCILEYILPTKAGRAGFGIKVRSSFTFHRILKKPLVISITNGFLLGEITRNGIT